MATADALPQALDKLKISNAGVCDDSNQDETVGQEPPLQVRMTQIQECLCTEYDGHHFSIETKESELRQSAGVAVSYTWGEFDRQQHRVGHVHRNPTEIVSLCLGAEWLVDGFMRCLAELTAEFGACWIDQICVPQSDEKVRGLLGAIPVLYKTFDVIIILPGPICGCLRRTYDAYETAKLASRPTEDQVSRLGEADNITLKDLEGALNSNPATAAQVSRLREADKIVLKDLEDALFGQRCINSNGNCSYTERAWPRQEFRYARSLLVKYANREVVPCSTVEDLINLPGENRSPTYLRLLARRFMTRVERLKSTELLVLTSNTLHLADFNFIVIDRVADGGYLQLREHVARLLLGYNWTPVRLQKNSFQWLLDTLMIMGVSARGVTVTEARDYIVPIWVGWTAYRIPQDFKRLSVEALLADALGQISSKLSLVVPSRCPAGLMGAESATWSWAAIEYKAGCKIETAMDLYGPFVWQFLLYCTDNSVGIPVRAPGRDEEELLLFADWPYGSNAIRAGGKMLEIFSRLRADMKMRNHMRQIKDLREGRDFALLLRSSEPSKQVEGFKCLFTTVLGGKEIWPSASEALANLQPNVVERAMFDLVCDSMWLDPEMCRRHNVMLAFKEWQYGHGSEQLRHTCIGLVNQVALNRARQAGRTSLTIAERQHTRYPTYVPLYQAVPCSNGKHQEFAVVGVWLPLEYRHGVPVCASMVHEDQEHDGYII